MEQGAAEYDDPVVEHWPAFADDEAPKAGITLRQVLCHTAGVPYGEFDEQAHRWGDWDAVAEAMEGIEPVFDPLGMDRTSIGLGGDEDDDVATLVGFEMFDRCRDPGEGLGTPAAESAAAFNDEAVRRAVIPAANGIHLDGPIARTG